MTQDPARQRAVEALAEALDAEGYVSIAVPAYFTVLDAHPEAKAALLDWLLNDVRVNRDTATIELANQPIADEVVAAPTTTGAET